ncbi:MAG: CIA30 family protein [Flavobacteriaceae bacterium]|nr:CIA30 family protein [Flavobacteriaceae bacterium]
MITNKEIIVFDTVNNKQRWYTTNDDVMGGISNSSLIIDDKGKAIFSGEVSIENNGGFAMTRLPVDIKLTSNNSKVILKIKGDGKKYQLRIKSKRFQKHWYIYAFQTSNDVQELEIPLKGFYPSFRGYQLNLENFSSNCIKEIAILIGNKKNEKFNLQIEKISIR